MSEHQHSDPERLLCAAHFARQTNTARVIERAARAIFWELTAVTNDHANAWDRCDKKVRYRDAARAAILGAALGGGDPS